MLTREQLGQGLELTDAQVSVIFEFIEDGKIDAGLHVASDILGCAVDTLAASNGTELVSFVMMTSHDVTTLMYDHLSEQFFVRTLTSWLEENEDNIPNSPPSQDAIVEDDEPYVMFYWKNGDILAAQIDGMKELISEYGQPEKYEIVSPSVDIFED